MSENDDFTVHLLDDDGDDEFDDEETCHDCQRVGSMMDTCGVCGVAMCGGCYEMGCGVCKGPHR